MNSNVIFSNSIVGKSKGKGVLFISVTDKHGELMPYFDASMARSVEKNCYSY